MGLMSGTGPLGRNPAGTFNFEPPPAGRALYMEPCEKWIRVVVGGETIADTRHALLLSESGHQPVYYFPPEDVRADVLEPSDRHTRCPKKGEASYYTIRAGDSVAVQILDRLDTDLTQVRQQTLRLIHDSSPDPAGPPRGLVPRPRTPEDVLDLRRRALAGRDPDGFAALFAPDAVLESPFAAPPVPSRIEGRESIRRIAEAQMASPQRITDIETVALHHTDDPEVIIAEIVTRGTEADGTAFAIPCVQVFRIRDGQIVSFRDYAGPAPR